MNKELPVRQLGRNDATPPAPDAYRTTPNLAPSELFPGMQAVKSEDHGFFGTRTGRNGSA